jgi:predicted Holliday junction resolvase-like endonuclease
MTWEPVALVGLALCAGYLFISRRRLQEKLREREANVSTLESSERFLESALSESRALFDLRQEENRDLKSRLDSVGTRMSEKEVALLQKEASLTWANQSLLQKEDELVGVQQTLAFEQEQYRKLIGQKKSSEVRTGKIAEQISPFLADYPVDPSTARFIGDPIDFCHFLDNKVVFVEVKSGKSQLSTKQRRIRDLIKEGKVEFIVYRVEGK